MNDLPYASYWLAAAESGYARCNNWSSWADQKIVELASPPMWVIELSLAKTVDDLWRILRPIIDGEVRRGFDRGLIHEAALGYVWLRFERGDIDLRTCLDLAGRYADNYQTSIECEAFFGLLNKLESKAGTSDVDVIADARKLFDPFRSLAGMQWTLLSTPSPRAGELVSVHST